MTTTDLIWVGGMPRDVADMLFGIVVKQAVRSERERFASHIHSLIAKQGDASTGHAKAKLRAYREVLEFLIP